MFPTPTEYAKIASRNTFLTPPHILHLEKIFLQTLAGQLPPRCLVELSVRHGKSEFFSKYVPAWFLSCFPNKRVILAGYGHQFATEFGRDVRQIFDSTSSLFGLPKAEGQSSSWGIPAHSGRLVTCGSGSGIAGRGGHLIVADDLVRDQMEAESALRRDRLYKWVSSDLLTRLEPGGVVFVILSRRHPDDLVGRLHGHMESGGAPWTVVRLPALAEENDPLGRSPGSALWPDRYPKEKLEEIRSEYELKGQSYQWNCLYQQDATSDPALTEWPDSYFKNVMYDELPPSLETSLHVLSVDPAKGSQNKAGDTTALLSVLRDTNGHLWVQDGHISILPLDQLEDNILALYVAGVHGIVIESNHFQESVAISLMKRRPGIPVHKHVSTDDKEVRIRVGLTPLLAQGMLHIRNRPFGLRLLSQLKSFPTGRYVDGPDALDMAVKLINKLLTTHRPQPKRVLSVR